MQGLLKMVSHTKIFEDVHSKTKHGNPQKNSKKLKITQFDLTVLLSNPILAY